MIEIKNLTKKFDSKVAVDNLSLNITDGISGLVGENGAGKSTLFRLISGVYTPSDGEVYIDGHKSDTKEAKEKVFFLSDEPFYSLNDTPLSLFKTYEAFYNIDKERYISILKKFKLPYGSKINSYSKGMKRQTFIALALSINVNYLLLDEAFDGLDPLVLDSIKEEIIARSKEGKCIVISSHNIGSLQNLVNRFIILYKGSLADESENEDLASSMIKLQLYFSKPVSEQELLNTGLKIVSYKTVGSIIHIVLNEEKDYEEKILKIAKPIIMEQIPIDKDEAVKLLMLEARKENENE